jgi:hypothetical protein
MTIVASVLFLSALAASVFAIASTIRNAMPRIREVIGAEFGPQITIERRISFGPVRYLQAVRPANVVAFPLVVRADQEFKLAA